ncbi:phage tail protein I [Helicobacter winghamensis]|uniref:phage tail protein I n=1 Tax=Helicobacter winghamensis TaxID=157268 RepID=UPI00279BBD6A
MSKEILVLSHHKSEAKAIDLSVKQRLEDLPLNKISNLALRCDERLLPILANAYDVSIDHLNKKEARALISKALLLDRHNGTAYAIKEALKAVFPTAVVKEWFDYGGEPYYFKVKVVSMETSFDEESFKKLERLIQEFKNVRSVLESIELEIQSKNNSFNVVKEVSGERIELLPFVTTQIQSNTKASTNAFVVFICEVSQTNISFKGVY